MSVVLRWLTGVGRFWFGFIIGDDWTVAVALMVTWLLHTLGVVAWWLPPAAAAVAVGLSLRRTGW